MILAMPSSHFLECMMILKALFNKISSHLSFHPYTKSGILTFPIAVSYEYAGFD